MAYISAHFSTIRYPILPSFLFDAPPYIPQVREKESSIDTDVAPILDLYTMLEHYIPGCIADGDEIEMKGSILIAWSRVVEHADAVSKR